jgi:phosphoribosylglycinamide formyltransferase 1
MKKKKIAIFASGSGTNAENIVRFFKDSPLAEISLIMANRPDAYVLQRAANLAVESYVFNRDDFYNSSKVIDKLNETGIELIVLAGFLWLVPENLIELYSNRIVNIHPALLPKYGGKGMYGMKVHEAVIANAETESGITIHFVNSHYDEGNIISQHKCSIKPGDTPEMLAEKIHGLEYTYYPQVIEKIVEAMQKGASTVS